MMLECGVMGGFKFFLGQVLAGLCVGLSTLGLVAAGYALYLYLEEKRKK